VVCLTREGRAVEPRSRTLLSPQCLLPALLRPLPLRLSLFVSARNANSFRKLCLRNAYISGVVFSISPSEVMTVLSLGRMHFAMPCSVECLMPRGKVADRSFFKLKCHLRPKLGIMRPVQNSSLLAIHCESILER